MSIELSNEMSNDLSDSALRDVASQVLEGDPEEMTSQYEDSVAEPNATEEPSPAEEPRVAEHRIPSLASDTEFELPLPLRHLISSGGVSGEVKLVAVPDNTWNIDGYAAKLRRTLSVSFSVDSAISAEEVMESFCNLGVDAEDIASVQYRGSNRSWCVSFCTIAVKELVLEKGVVRFGDSFVFIGDADFKTVIVKVYKALPEMPDMVVSGVYPIMEKSFPSVGITALRPVF